MKKRKISTLSQPLLSPDGTILKNMRVAFVLVDENGRPCDTFDYETGERIAGNPVYVRTDVNGEFEVELFPNTRGTTTTFYLVRVLDAEVDDFVAALEDGSSTIDLIAFKYGGVTITPEQYDLLQGYLDRLDELLTGVIDDENIRTDKTWSSARIISEVVNPNKAYVFIQDTPATEWLINHGLDRTVNVTLFDTDGALIVTTVSRIDSNSSLAIFSEPMAGEAYVR